MAYFHQTYNDYCQILDVLRLLKTYHEAGIYGEIVRTSETICEDDYYEFYDLGLEHAAPIVRQDDWYYDGRTDAWRSYDDIEDFDENEWDYPNRLFWYSSPDMQEFYRLCRQYEAREGISPAENPFLAQVIRQVYRLMRTVSQVWIGFYNEEYSAEILVEISPETGCDAAEIVDCIHKSLAYYSEHLNALRLELAKGPTVVLPALPSWKGGSHAEN